MVAFSGIIPATSFSSTLAGKIYDSYDFCPTFKEYSICPWTTWAPLVLNLAQTSFTHLILTDRNGYLLFMRKGLILNADLETETKLSSGIILRTICCVIPLVSREFKSQIIRLLNVLMLRTLWKIPVELKELKCGPGLTIGDMTDSPPWKRVILKISTPHLSTTENILRPKEIAMMSIVIKFWSLSQRLSQIKILPPRDLLARNTARFSP